MDTTSRAAVASNDHAQLGPDGTFVTPRLRISEDDITGYCTRYGDKNIIHLRRPMIAPGLLLLEMGSGLVQQMQLTPGIPVFREVRRWKFQKRVVADDEIYLRFTMQQEELLNDMKLAVLELKMFNQRDEVVGSGTWEIVIYPSFP